MAPGNSFNMVVFRLGINLYIIKKISVSAVGNNRFELLMIKDKIVPIVGKLNLIIPTIFCPNTSNIREAIMLTKKMMV